MSTSAIREEVELHGAVLIRLPRRLGFLWDLKGRFWLTIAVIAAVRGGNALFRAPFLEDNITLAADAAQLSAETLEDAAGIFGAAKLFVDGSIYFYGFFRECR